MATHPATHPAAHPAPRALAAVIADMHDMEASIDSAQPYYTPSAIERLHAEAHRAAETEHIAVWRTFDDGVIAQDEWLARARAIEANLGAADDMARRAQAMRTDRQEGLA